MFGEGNYTGGIFRYYESVTPAGDRPMQDDQGTRDQARQFAETVVQVVEAGAVSVEQGLVVRRRVANGTALKGVPGATVYQEPVIQPSQDRVLTEGELAEIVDGWGESLFPEFGRFGK